MRRVALEQCSTPPGETHWPEWLALDLWSQNWNPTLWRAALNEGIAEAEVQARLHQATQTGRPLGGVEFVERCEQELGVSLRRQKPGPKAKPLLSDVANHPFEQHVA
jgi:hypothetical protein